MNLFKLTGPFFLEGGGHLPELTIGYETFGQLNEDRSNVVWVFHALTGNSDPLSWWPGLIGSGEVIDPGKQFIVCANMLGSCYGSTSATSLDPLTGKRYGVDFPLVSIRDMVRAHQVLQQHLGIHRIQLGIGGSMGGQQLLEWAVMDPGLFSQVCLLATNARHSAWGIAFNEAQRMALESDPTLFSESDSGGAQGLAAARAIAMLSYRTYQIYENKQSDPDRPLQGHRAGSYQRYQGKKLQERFDAWSYLSLSRSMDSHDVGRERGGVKAALQRVQARALVVGVRSDILFPPREQKEIARGIPRATYVEIASDFGHDGFLVETRKISEVLSHFLNSKPLPPASFPLPNPLALPGTEPF